MHDSILDQIVTARESVVRYALHHGFKTMHSLNETQQGLLRAYHETGDRTRLHLLADALMEGGAPVHGEMLLHGLESGYIHPTSDLPTGWEPFSEVLAHMGYVRRSPTTPPVPALMGRMMLNHGPDSPGLFIDVPSSAHHLADIEEAHDAERGFNPINNRRLLDLREGAVRTWGDHYPKHQYHDPHRPRGLEDLSEVQETE